MHNTIMQKRAGRFGTRSVEDAFVSLKNLFSIDLLESPSLIKFTNSNPKL